MLPTYVHRWHITDEYNGRPPWQLAKVTWPFCSLAHRRTYFRQQTEAVEVVDWVVVIRVGPVVGHVIYRGAGGDGPRQLRRRQGRCCVVCPGSCSGDSVQGGGLLPRRQHAACSDNVRWHMCERQFPNEREEEKGALAVSKSPYVCRFDITLTDTWESRHMCRAPITFVGLTHH
jgi:hypothetical protein